MKEVLIDLFGHGKDLSPVQMGMRTLLVFGICLIFIRVSGRRSFSMRMPFDNVMTILLGAVLGRAIVGASPFLSTMVSGAVIVVLHRLCAGLAVYSKWFGKVVKGEDKIIFEHGKLLKKNMQQCMVTGDDVMEEMRITSHLDSLDKVKRMCAERNGDISIVKKNE